MKRKKTPIRETCCYRIVQVAELESGREEFVTECTNEATHVLHLDAHVLEVCEFHGKAIKAIHKQAHFDYECLRKLN